MCKLFKKCDIKALPQTSTHLITSNEPSNVGGRPKLRIEITKNPSTATELHNTGSGNRKSWDSSDADSTIATSSPFGGNQHLGASSQRASDNAAHFDSSPIAINPFSPLSSSIPRVSPQSASANPDTTRYNPRRSIVSHSIARGPHAPPPAVTPAKPFDINAYNNDDHINEG